MMIPKAESTSSMGWEEAAANFPEIPKGRSARKIWMDAGTYPLFAVIGLASAVCGGFLFKYFAGHTDIALSRAVRADHNHQGGTDGRVESHNSRFGMREMNKRTITIFPFNWKPKSAIIEQHRSD